MQIGKMRSVHVVWLDFGGHERLTNEATKCQRYVWLALAGMFFGQPKMLAITRLRAGKQSAANMCLRGGSISCRYARAGLAHSDRVFPNDMSGLSMFSAAASVGGATASQTCYLTINCMPTIRRSRSVPLAMG